MTSVRQVQQLTAEEIPADVMEAANNAYLDAEGRHGTGAAIEAAIAVAFNAGRESALDHEEWRSVFPAVEGLREYSRGRDRSVELAWLGQCRELHGDGCHLQHRRSGATGWEKVADAT